jgi:hypothetical protein
LAEASLAPGSKVGMAVGEQQLSRRQALKRGAAVGGALVWTVPVVQAVSMTAGHAVSASAPPPPKQKHVTGGSAGDSGSSQAGGSSDQLSFTGSAVPATTAAVVGGALVATGVVATVAASRGRRLSADGPAESTGHPVEPLESTED